MMKIYPYKNHTPVIDESVFLADGVVITGDVHVKKDASIWFNTVIRGDVAPTYIGEGVNIQDNSTLHQSPDNPLVLEDGVTVGHQCILHSCKVKKEALIGMGATILDRAEIGEGAFVGAGSLVPPGKKIPPGTLALGSPAKVVRELTEEDIKDMARIRREYVEKGHYYKGVIEGEE
ncbi:gamma carbonic anhydrase family protein [Bacillus sp. H-16]|uniref:gamma carbonic anhydrase n=1 Tax=Alteribacter salitolerans TaxID=2912333 RepID=UPI0019629B1C|nr:gamma carbonic anhydrase family protein [Alteribacter salitolerans]MBM7096348.1 gamma carbonic anhydrase family protein [Alteribacter salitolerans]